MNLNFYNKLTDYIEAERIYREEPMKKHTTFRVGGNADYFVVPKTEKEWKGLSACVKKKECHITFLGMEVTF